MDILAVLSGMVRDLDICRTVGFTDDFDFLGWCLICTGRSVPRMEYM